MDMKVVRPSESELSCSARTNIMCPVKDCKKVLPQPPALRLHMVKVHKIVENCKDDHLLHRTKASAETGVTVCYKCPVSECIFNGPRHFTMWKSLKQHYMKIHAEKKFCCETCDLKFGLRADLKRHLTTNHGHKGKDALNMPHMLTCSTQQRVCERDAVTQGQTGAELGTTTYPSTSPTTSCVRVKPPGQGQGAPLLPKPNIVVMAGRERQGMQGQLIFIADACPPRQTLPLLAPQLGLAGIAQRQKHVNTQTLVTFDERETGRDWQPVSRGRRRNHSSTQTLAVKRRRNVAQTQTTGDFILRRAMRSANIPIRKASTGCQMSPVTEPSGWCNKSTKNGPTQTLVPRAVPRQWKTNLVDASTAGCLASLSQPMVMSVDAACSTWDVSPGGSTWDLPLPETMSTLTSNQLDTETQTMVLLEELQASLAESISTQTFESFLETTATTSSCQDERPQNSAQTQTRHSVLSLEPCFAPTDQSLCQSPITGYASDPLFGGCSTDDLDLSGKYMSQSNLVSTRGQQGTPLLTDNFDFLNTQSQTGDLDPDYMHMETQTSIEDIFDQLLSNMETQTSDDVFGDMEFTDIYTQTTLKPEPSSSFDSSSTETQTSLHTLVQSTNMAEFSNTETQTLFTGIDFGTTLADSHTQTTWNDLESVI